MKRNASSAVATIECMRKDVYSKGFFMAGGVCNRLPVCGRMREALLMCVAVALRGVGTFGLTASQTAMSSPAVFARNRELCEFTKLLRVLLPEIVSLEGFEHDSRWKLCRAP